MLEASLDYAETHFPQLLMKVMGGEEVLLRKGAIAVARIVPVTAGEVTKRPQVGEITSAPVDWSKSSFAPLDDAGMEELGLM